MPTAEEPDMLLQQCIAEAKAAYTELRRRWKPAYGGPDHSKDRLWLRLARTLVNAGGDPWSYVQWAFDIFAETHADCYIEQLTATGMLQKWVATVRPGMKERLQRLITLQSDTVHSRLAAGAPLAEVLLDESEQLSAVFRLAAARSAGREDLAAAFLADAERQVRFEPYYIELLGRWLPPDWSARYGSSRQPAQAGRAGGAADHAGVAPAGRRPAADGGSAGQAQTGILR